MKKAVAYYRVSTKRQGKSGLGLKAQKTAVRTYANEKNLHISKEFIETKSGGIDGRASIRDAIDYCHQCGAILLIAKQDRLARSVKFVATLMESDVEFIAVDDPHADELMRHIKAAFDHYERKKRSQRAKETAQELKRKGVKLGTNGKKLSRYYQKRRHRRDKKLKPLLIKLRSAGMSIEAVARELSRRGYKNFRGGTSWHSSTVHGIMRRNKIL